MKIKNHIFKVLEFFLKSHTYFNSSSSKYLFLSNPFHSRKTNKQTNSAYHYSLYYAHITKSYLRLKLQIN